MPCIPVQGGYVCVSDGEYQIRVGAKWWLFEWHRYFGPMPISKRDHSTGIDAPRSFYDAAGLWDKQGRRIVDGWCVWEKEPTPKYVHLVGKHYAEAVEGGTEEQTRERWLRKAPR